jgi:hypothetical protein
MNPKDFDYNDEALEQEDSNTIDMGEEIQDFLELSTEENFEEETDETAVEEGEEEDADVDEGDPDAGEEEEDDDHEEADTEIEDDADETDDDDSTADEETDEDETELGRLKKSNKELLALIEKGVAESLGMTSIKEKTAAQGDGETTPASLADLIGEIDFAEMNEDPTLFVEMMQKVVDHTRQSTIDGLRAELPTVINQRTEQVLDVRALVDNFYRENKDLAAVKKTVGAITQTLGTENPEMGMEKLLQEAAIKTRSLLGIPDPGKPTKGKTVKRNSKPVSPRVKGKRTRGPNPKLSKVQKQINELLEF